MVPLMDLWLLIVVILCSSLCNASVMPPDNTTNIEKGESSTPVSTGGIWPYIKQQSEAMYLMWIPHFWFNQTSNPSSFVDGFGSSLIVTTLSELGDKTFFITAILATRHSRFIVYTGAMTALALMTLTATALGYAAHFVPRYIIHYASIFLFVLYGIHMLYDGVMKCRRTKSKSDDEDLKEEGHGSAWYKSPFLKAFLLILFAEWGDRSQIATIVLSATRTASAVFVGALLAHALCTLLATVAGRFLERVVPVAALTIVGGLMFLAFAAIALATGYSNPM